MSLFSLPYFSLFRSRKSARRSKGGRKDTRRLVIDSLEKREMLSVTPLTSDVLLADLSSMGVPATTTPMVAGQSVAVNHAGDIVATWQMSDGNDYNVYARYLTDQVERLVLPPRAFEAGAGAQLGLLLYLPGGATTSTTVTLGTVTQTSYNQTAIANALGASVVTVKQVTGYSEQTGQSELAKGAFDIEYTGALGKRDLTRVGIDNQPLPALVITSLVDARGWDWINGADGVAWPTTDRTQPDDDAIVLLTKVSSPIFRVNAPEAPDPVTGVPTGVAQVAPSVAMDSDGDFVIAWQGVVPDSVTPGSANDVFARRFSPINYLDWRFKPYKIVNGQPTKQSYLLNSDLLPATSEPYASTQVLSNETMMSVYPPAPATATSCVVAMPKADAANLQVDDRVDIYWGSTTSWANGRLENAKVLRLDTSSPTAYVTLDLRESRIPSGSAPLPTDVTPSQPLTVQLMAYKWTLGVYALGNEYRVNTFTANPQGEPNVGMDDNGNFVIAWADQGQDLSYFNGIRAQRFNREGQRVGNEWRVNTENAAEHYNPYVALSNDGIFAVVWSSSVGGQGVLGEIYDFNATSTPADPTAGERPLYNQFLVDAANPTAFAGYVVTPPNPSAAFDYRHNLVVSWNEARVNDNVGPRGARPNYPGASDVIAKMYRVDLPAPAGQTIPTEVRSRFRVNSANADPNSTTTWSFDQRNSQVGIDADGDFVITYDGFGPDVSQTDSLTAPNGEANGALYSTFDAGPYTPEGGGAIGFLSTDNVANTTRDGQDEVYTLTIDGRTTGGNFSLRLRSFDLGGPDPILSTPEDILTIPIGQRTLGTFPTYDREQTRINIDNVLQSAQRDGLQLTTGEGTFRVTNTTNPDGTPAEVATSDIYWLNFYGTNIKGTFRLLLEAVRTLANSSGITNPIYFDYTNLEGTRLAIETELQRMCVTAWPGAVVTVALNSPPLVSPNQPVTPGATVTYQFAVTFGGNIDLTGDATTTGMRGQHNIRGIWQDLSYPADSGRTFYIDSVQVRAGSLINEVQTLNFYGSPDMSGNVKLRLGHQNEVQTISFGSETQLIAFPAQPTGGAFRITFYDPVTGAGATTNFLDYNATAADVARELNALATVRNNNGMVYVTNPLNALGQPIPYQYLVTFQGDLRDGNQIMMTVDATTLIPVTAPTITETPRGTGVNEVQTLAWAPETQRIQFLGTPTAGTWTITYPDPDGTGPLLAETTASLPYNATTGDVSAALLNLAAIDGITVTGGAGTYDVTFTGVLIDDDVPMMTVNMGGLTPVTPATVAEIVKGGGPQSGNWSIAFDPDGTGPLIGYTTGALAYNATVPQVTTALNALTSITNVSGSVYVNKPTGTSYRVTFLKGLGFKDVPLLVANTGGLTPPRLGSENFVQTVQGEIAGPQPFPTGGTWTLSFKGFTTTSLNSNATFGEVQAALEALPSIGVGQVNVVQGANARSYVVTFGGSLALSDQPPLVARGALSPNILPAIVETTMGSPVTEFYFSTDLNTSASNLRTALAAMRPGYPGVTVTQQNVPSTWPDPQPTYQLVVTYGGESAGIDVPALEQATDTFTIDAMQVTNWAAEEQYLRIFATPPTGQQVSGRFTIRVGGVSSNPLVFNGYDLYQTAANIQAALRAAPFNYADVLVAPKTATQGGKYEFDIRFIGASAAQDVPAVEIESVPSTFTLNSSVESAVRHEIQYLDITMDAGPETQGTFKFRIGGAVSGDITVNPANLAGTATEIQGALRLMGYYNADYPLGPTVMRREVPAGSYRFEVQFIANSGFDIQPIQQEGATSLGVNTISSTEVVKGTPEKQLVNFFGGTDMFGYFSVLLGQDDNLAPIESGRILFDSNDLDGTAERMRAAIEAMPAEPGRPNYVGVQVDKVVPPLNNPQGQIIYQFRVTFSGASASIDVANIGQGEIPWTFTSSVSQEVIKGQIEQQHLNFYGSGSMIGTFTLLFKESDSTVWRETSSMVFDSTDLVGMASQIQQELRSFFPSTLTRETQSFDFGAETQQIAFSAAPTGGAWTITFPDPDGTGPLFAQTTADLRYNASPYEVETALNALSSLKSGGGRVVVNNGVGTNVYLVTFLYGRADQDLLPMTVDASRITPVTAAPVTEVVKGFSTGPGGTWTLSFDRDGTGPLLPLVTGAIPAAATPEEVQSALNAALASIGGTVTVVTGTSANSFKVTFGGLLSNGDQPSLTISAPSLPLPPPNRIPYVMSEFAGVTVVSQSPTPPPSTLPTYQFLVTFDGVSKQADVDLIRAGEQPIRVDMTQGANGAKISETQHLNFYGPVVPYSYSVANGVAGVFNLLLGGASTDSVCPFIITFRDAGGNIIPPPPGGFPGIPFVGYNQWTAYNIRLALERLSNFAYNGVQVTSQPVTTPPVSPNLTPEGQFLVTFDGRMSGRNVPEIQYGGVPASVSSASSFSVDANWFQMGGTQTTYTVMFVGEAHDRRFTLEVAPSPVPAVTSLPLTEEQIILIPSTREGFFALGLAGVAGKTPDMFFDPRDPWATAQVIQNGLRGLLPGNIWVRWVDGTAYNFRVSFGGTLVGANQPPIQWRQPDHVYVPTDPSDDPNLTPFSVWDNQPAGGPIFTATTPPGLAETQPGFRGVTQNQVSVGMTPSGDFVTTWVQWDADLTNGRKIPSDLERTYSAATMFAQGIYYRRFDESTDTAGPLVTDVLDVDGSRLADNTQLTHETHYLIATFDEDMLNTAGDISRVTNPANWTLLRNGVTVPGGIAHIEYGMNRSVEPVLLGGSGVGSNKYEAVLYFDGDATLPGNDPLGDGSYQIVATANLRDLAGNPLARTGWLPNGQLFKRSFGVVVASSSETRVSPYPDPTLYPANGDGTINNGIQPTYPDRPQSPRQVASDAEGNFVAVYTSDETRKGLPDNHIRGVYARLYQVDDRPYTSPRIPHASDVVIRVSDTPPSWEYSNAAVAMDADGDFVVAWTARDPATDAATPWGETPPSWDIYYRVFSADGTPKVIGVNVDGTPKQCPSLLASEPTFQEGDTRKRPNTKNIQQWPSIAMDADGDFVITWQSLEQDGSGYGVYAQRFAPNGYSVGGTDETQVLTFDEDSGIGADSYFTLTFAPDQWTVDDDGDIVVVTTDKIFYNNDTSTMEDDIVNAMATAFIDANHNGVFDLGEVRSPIEVQASAISATEFLVRFVGANGSKNQPPMTANGHIWGPGTNPADPSTFLAPSVRTATEGKRGEFRVNDFRNNNQMWPDVAMAAGGRFVITWTSFGQQEDGQPANQWESNVYAKTYASSDVYRQSSAGATAETIFPGWDDGRVMAPMISSADPNNPAIGGGTYDAVVSLKASRIDGEVNATGVLLKDRQHILTAAHVVANDVGRMVTTNVAVTFNLAGSTVTFNSDQIIVLPGYTGNIFTGGHDLAIITLPQAAPAGVVGYEIYQSTDERFRNFTKVGYGWRGQGNTGWATNSYGVKRSAQNRYDGYGETLGYYPDTLVSDFDNGLAANDAFGVLYATQDLGVPNLGGGNSEGIAAEGDSGGPNFVNVGGVNYIAGITSWITAKPGPDILPGLNASYGEFSGDTRVSTYASWINQILSGGMEFLVNERTSSIQKWSSVAMDYDGDFVVTWTSYNQDGVGTGYGGGNTGQEGVFARRFDKAFNPTLANPANREFRVNTFSDKQQQWPRVSMDADGDFVIAWESYQDRPAPPYNDPDVPPDVPNSYGIYAQRFSSNARAGYPAGVGYLGGEFRVSTSTAGNQRFPSIALDATGDFVVVWSGAGNQLNQDDDQGVFFSRYDEARDQAGPIVTEVLNSTALNEMGEFTPVYNGTTLRVPKDAVLGSYLPDLTQDPAKPPYPMVSSLIVLFSEDMIQGSPDLPESILNPGNWRITRDGRTVVDGITAIENIDAGENIVGDVPKESRRYKLTFAEDVWVLDDPATTDKQEDVDAAPQFLGLDPGKYVLSLYPEVRDLSGNYLDGNYDGVPGGLFNFTFAIRRSGELPERVESPDNAYTAGNQNDPAIASDGEGNYVVVWVSYGQSGDAATIGNIVAQRFDPNGTKVDNEFIVNTYMTGNQYEPDVAMDNQGNFLVVWSGEGRMDQTTNNIEYEGIFGRWFDMFGHPLEEPLHEQFRVNTQFLDKQHAPAVAMAGSLGTAVVTWSSIDGNTQRDAILVQRYKAFRDQGAPSGSYFTVASPDVYDQDRSDVAMDAQGNFVVVWNKDMRDEYQWSVFGKRYNAAGEVLRDEFPVNDQGLGNQMFPVVAMDPDGDFVVAWTSDFPAADPYGYGVYARLYSKTADPVGGEHLVNQQRTEGWQSDPTVDWDDNGNFRIAWVDRGHDNPWGSDDGVYMSVFRAADWTRSGEELVNKQNFVGNQNDPAITVAPDGNFYIAWVGPDTPTSVNTNIWGLVAPAPAAGSVDDWVYRTTMYGVADEVGQIQPLGGVGMTTPGLYDPVTSIFYLRDSNSTGMATYMFGYGEPNGHWTPIMGDWDGDGDQTIGFFDPATSLFYLRNSNTVGYADLTFGFGAPGLGWLPLVGDWNNDGVETIGLFDPATSMFYLTNGHSTGYADITFGFGAPNSGWKPLMGDWNGNGVDTLGLYDPATSYFFLRDTNSTGYADYTFGYGGGYSGWTPIVGDWNRDSKDTVGFYDPSTSVFMLRNTNSGGYADVAFGYGAAGLGWTPLVGRWDSPYYLMAEGGTVVADAQAVGQQELTPIVAEAMARWSAAGLDAASLAYIAQAQVIVTDLPGNELGMADENLVYIDRDAAGRGWFVDDTPQSDAEFTVRDGRLTAIDAAAVDRIDLLSVVAHELGHAAGLADLDEAVEDVMGAMLSTSVRRMPGVLATDAIFGEAGLEG